MLSDVIMLIFVENKFNRFCAIDFIRLPQSKCNNVKKVIRIMRGATGEAGSECIFNCSGMSLLQRTHNSGV